MRPTQARELDAGLTDICIHFLKLGLGSFHHVSVAASPQPVHESCLSGDFHSTHPMVSVTLYSVVRSNGELMVICSADARSPPVAGDLFLTDWCNVGGHSPASLRALSHNKPGHHNTAGSCLDHGLTGLLVTVI